MGWKQKINSILKIIVLKDFPLMFKLCTYFALLILIPMIMVSVISYKQSAEIIEKEAEQYNQQIIQQVKKHVEHYVRDLKLDTLKVLHHPDIKTFLKMRSPEEVEQSGIRDSVQSLLKDTAGFRSDINNITIISEGIQIIDLMGINGTYPAGDLLKEYWYPTVPLNGDTMLITRTIPWQNRMEPVVSIVRRAFNPETLEPTGMIIIDVNFKRFQEIVQMVEVGQTGFMYILDSHGHYVYHPDLMNLGKPVDIEQSGRLLQGESGVFQTSKGSNDFLTSSQSSSLGWTLVISTPYNELTKGISQIGQSILFTCLIALVISTLLAIGLSKSLIRPIRKLQQFMHSIEEGDFSKRLEVESKDEIGQLTNGFNIMVSKLAELLEEIYVSKLNETQLSLRQKETELKVLQSQINPHFLYNSLETIRGMALDKEMDDIGDMAASLAKLLRYNLKNNSFLISLKEELTACKVYLRIQKYRFEEKIEYQFDIDDWALEQSIVKFCLQPLVENCVIHGAEPHTGVTKISIKTKYDTSSSFIIEISDNGAGISDEILQNIRRGLANKEMDYGGKHIGIVNVHKRIVYLFGEDYGLHIEGNHSQGTTVIIRLPISNVNDHQKMRMKEHD